MNEYIPGHTTTDFGDRPNRCPECGKLLSASTSVESGPGLAPDRGSLSLCWFCGALAVFDENLRLRELTSAEWLQVKRSSQ